MQPIPTADGFIRGAQGRENMAMGRTPGDDNKQTRRRGAELEGAILDAAWEQLIAEGDEHFTIDTVAARARTSKPVLYRRWKTREDLLRATVRHRGAADPPVIPDTGTLRGDLLALLTQANTDRNPMAALVSSMLGSYYNQAGPSPAELRDAFLTQRGSVVERGEIDPDRLPPRIISLPFDLFRHEMMMTLKPVPDHVLRQIVDDIFIPLVSPRPLPQAEGTVLRPPASDQMLTAGRRGRLRPVVEGRARWVGVEGVRLDEAVADHEGVGSQELVFLVAVAAEGEVDDLALHVDRGRQLHGADERKNLLVD